MGDVSSTDWHDSKIVCNCTHLESEHLVCGGCRHINEKNEFDCDCPRYDQTALLKQHTEKYLDHLLNKSFK